MSTDLTARLAALVNEPADDTATLLRDLYGTLGFTFHPDTPAADMLDTGWTPADCALIDTLIERAAADPTVDIYGICIDIGIEMGEIDPAADVLTPAQQLAADEIVPATYGIDGICTVGELRRIIATLDDDTHVVLADPEPGAWYSNVARIGIPNADGGPYSCLTLIPGTPLDTRQF